MKAVAAIFVGRGEPLVIDEVDLGDPGPGEVAVELQATGVCATQLHLMERAAATPCLLGHEASGRVVGVGSGVRDLEEGDLVLVSSAATIAPHEDLTRPHQWSWKGSTYANTDQVHVYTWATHTIVDERNLTRVSDDIPIAEASVLGCAGITGSGAVANDGHVEAGDDVAVWGVGGVGLFSIMAAAAIGARHIVAVDVDARALDLAKRLGATVCIDPRAEDAVTAILDATGGVNCAVDTVGSCSVDAMRVLRNAVPGKRRGGTAVLVQVSDRPVTVNLREMFFVGKTATMTTAGGGPPQADLRKYLDWFRNGRFPYPEVITRRYQLQEVNEACHALRSGDTFGRSILEFQ